MGEANVLCARWKNVFVIYISIHSRRREKDPNDKYINNSAPRIFACRFSAAGARRILYTDRCKGLLKNRKEFITRLLFREGRMMEIH